jgi:hypothetical protein
VTECNGCGGCCHPFTLPIGPGQLWGPEGNRVAEHEWMRAHLTPMRRSEGRALQPWAEGWDQYQDRDGRAQLRPGHYYRCDNYDEETRRCTDYENRPDICRRYPWFNGVPVPGAQLPPTCSFRADIGLPVEDVPVQVARSGARERNRKKGSGIS